MDDQGTDVKIVSKAELMRMPKGTLFADYHHDDKVMVWPSGPEMIFVGPCCRRDGAEPDDFFFIMIDGPDGNDSSEMMDRCFEMADSGKSFPVGLVPQREGLYDPDTRYLMWEPEDVQRIINLLQGGDD